MIKNEWKDYTEKEATHGDGESNEPDSFGWRCLLDGVVKIRHLILELLFNLAPNVKAVFIDILRVLNLTLFGKVLRSHSEQKGVDCERMREQANTSANGSSMLCLLYEDVRRKALGEIKQFINI